MSLRRKISCLAVVECCPVAASLEAPLEAQLVVEDEGGATLPAEGRSTGPRTLT